MSLLSYVASYGEVRVLLGVSEDELDDTMLSYTVFRRSLEEGLNEIDEALTKATGTLIAQFKTVSAIANASRTAAQQRFFDNVQVYASYHVASDLADSLPQFSPKTISDGKAMVQRHADSPYKIVIDGVRIGKARALARLKRAYATQLGDTPVSSVVTPIAALYISSPDADPVTGT
jgi:hypothetical protein